jgi:ribosomal protein L29
MGQLESPEKIRSIRRDLAKVLTVLRQKRGPA